MTHFKNKKIYSNDLIFTKESHSINVSFNWSDQQWMYFWFSFHSQFIKNLSLTLYLFTCHLKYIFKHAIWLYNPFKKSTILLFKTHFKNSNISLLKNLIFKFSILDFLYFLISNGLEFTYSVHYLWMWLKRGNDLTVHRYTFLMFWIIQIFLHPKIIYKL